MVQVVAAVKIRVDQTFIPDDWISSTFLKKCFERKGVESEGFIQSFHENYGRFGKKKVSELARARLYNVKCILSEPQRSCWLLFPQTLPESYSQHSNHFKQVSQLVGYDGEL